MKIIDYNTNLMVFKKKFKQLIKEDPDFLDSYLALCEIYMGEGRQAEAVKLLDKAYKRAIKLITDKKDNWPKALSIS